MVTILQWQSVFNFAHLPNLFLVTVDPTDNVQEITSFDNSFENLMFIGYALNWVLIVGDIIFRWVCSDITYSYTILLHNPEARE